MGDSTQSVFIAYALSTSAVVGFVNQENGLSNDRSRLTGLTGQRTTGSWEPIAVSIHRKAPGHFLHMSHQIVSNEAAWELLQPFVANDVEGIPLSDRNGNRYYFWNILVREEGIFDMERSRYYRNKETGQISSVFHYEFDLDKLKGRYVFRLPELPESPFVTREFVALVQQFGLTDIGFRPANMLEPIS